MLTIILLATLLVLYAYKKLKVPKEIEHIPGVPLLPIIVAILRNEGIYKTYFKLTKELYDKYGVVRVWSKDRWMVFVTDEAAVKEILFNHIEFPKHPITDHFPNFAIVKFVGKNVGGSNGKSWRYQRRTLNPAFKREFDSVLFAPSIEKFMGIIDENNGLKISIKECMQKVTLDMLGKGIFDVDFNSIQKSDTEIAVRFNELFKHAYSPLNLLIPYFDNPWNPLRSQAHYNAQWLLNEFRRIIKEKRNRVKEGVPYKMDALSYMIKASEEDTDFNDDLIVHNCAVLFLAGHETVATALAVILHLLAQYPECQEKCREEVKKIMKGETPTSSEIKEMKYLSCVIDEALRMYPISTKVSDRIATKDLRVGDMIIPKNTYLSVDLLALNRSKDAFKDPNEFNPDRFMDQNYGTIYSPFSSGTRFCLGKSLALQELRVTLSMILKKYKFSFTSPEDSELKFGFAAILNVRKFNLNFQKF